MSTNALFLGVFHVNLSVLLPSEPGNRCQNYQHTIKVLQQLFACRLDNLMVGLTFDPAKIILQISPQSLDTLHQRLTKFRYW